MARNADLNLPHSPAETQFVPARLVRRTAAAHYLGISIPTFDSYRIQGLVRPVPLPAARGLGPIRIPLFDVRDLDALIDKFNNGGRL